MSNTDAICACEVTGTALDSWHHLSLVLVTSLRCAYMLEADGLFSTIGAPKWQRRRGAHA